MSSNRRLCAAWALGGLALRLLVAARPLVVVDRWFVSDDAYYTLAIARSLAHGFGPTVDGVHLTNGFQPLLAFLSVPFFWLWHDADRPLRAVLVLLAVVDAALAFALGEVARRAALVRPERAAVLATAMWAASPVAIACALGGLETSLALLAAILLALGWSGAHRRGDASGYVGAGVLAGIAILARVDTLILVGALGVWEIARGRASRACVAAGVAAVVVAPWWAYELARFGTIVPGSAPAVRQLVAMHEAAYLTFPKKLAWALGAVIEAPIGSVVDVRSWLWHVAGVALFLTPPAIALGCVTITRWTRPDADRGPLRFALFFGLAAWVFYACGLPAVWFFTRYLAPTHVTMTVLVALGLARVSSWDARPRAGRSRALGAWALAAAVLPIPLAESLRYLVVTPAGTVDTALHGAKGYRDPAQFLLEAAPPGAVIGSLQSGALGYYAAFARPDVRVVNLDGVVDREAADALRTGHLAAFAQSRGVTHIADWAFNLENFLRRAGNDQMSLASFREIARARPQGDDTFVLAEVRWPGL